jgi:hypothetical protein
MKKYFFIIVMALSSCKSEYKQCNFQDTDTETTIYNEILIDIVENYLQNKYLGKSDKKVRDEFYDEKITVEEYKQEIIKLQNELFGDSTRYRTVYLMDTIKRERPNYFGLKETLEDDTAINRIAPDRKVMLESVNRLQQNYQISKFHACTFKVKLLSELKGKDTDMGVFTLSKLFLNKNGDEGLIAFNFSDGSWGEECFYQIKKINNRWKVVKGHILGIS